MTKRIFVSYAQDDNVYFPKLEQLLRLHGIIEDNKFTIINPLQDSIISGQNIRETLKKQIQSASVVVVIATDRSASSQWVNYELGMADALGKPIIVVASKGSEKSNFLSALSNYQYLEETILLDPLPEIIDTPVTRAMNETDWSSKFVRELAAREGLELTDAHWEVINFLRDYYKQYNIVPMIKILTKEIGKNMQHDIKELFPSGGFDQAVRLAGVRGKTTLQKSHAQQKNRGDRE